MYTIIKEKVPVSKVWGAETTEVAEQERKQTQRESLKQWIWKQPEQSGTTFKERHCVPGWDEHTRTEGKKKKKKKKRNKKTAD